MSETPQQVDPMAAAAQEEQRRQQQEEEERQWLAAEEAKNVRAVQDALRLRRLEACRAALLDHNLSPLSIDDQVALKELAVKLKLPPEAYLNRGEQKLKNLTTSKMLPEKLMKVVEELLLYPPGPDRALLEQMRPEDRLMRTQFMLHDEQEHEQDAAEAPGSLQGLRGHHRSAGGRRELEVGEAATAQV